jgi:hypothetical protein
MLSSFLGVLPILMPLLCALTLSCDQSPIPLLLTQHFHATAKTIAKTIAQVEQHCPSESHASSGRVPAFQGVCLQFKPQSYQNQWLTPIILATQEV